ncbi:tetratricopeptide repeat protein 38-like [Convolutriloba macropyga]|uniref:tetratricopeptide repeat protein 38-like n=1 Tax=Convolutriloba macropyga TaxID=536237 RepID=UPI003F524B06
MSVSSIDFSAPAVFHFPYEVSSPSAQIPKLLDQLVYSVLNFKKDVGEVFKSINEADPDCFVGEVLQTAAMLAENLVGTSVDRLHELADKYGEKLTDWESRWYDAVYTHKTISVRQGCRILMNLLTEYPFDLLAVFFGMFWAFYSVDKFMMRDLIGHVLPFHPVSHPYRTLLESFYGFALMETFATDRGSKMVESAFQSDPRHPWIIHTECHSLEYNGRTEDALALLRDEKEWYEDSLMGYHNTWHIAYLLAEHEQYDESLEVLQSSLIDQVVSASQMSDACALLWSLRFANHKVDNADFTKLLVKMSDKITEHGSPYFATHFAAALIGAEDYSGYNTFRHSVNNFMSNFKEHDIVQKYESFGLNMMDSITAYSLEDFQIASNKMAEVQDGILTFGGSQTQREFYYQLMYSSMLKMRMRSKDKQLFCSLNSRTGYRSLPPSAQRLYDELSKVYANDRETFSFCDYTSSL